MAYLAWPDACPSVTYLKQPRGNGTLSGFFQTKPLENIHAGQAVFWEGDEASNAVQVVHGVLRLYRILHDGRRAIVGFAFQGDVRGVAFHGSYLYTAEAVTEAAVRRLSCRHLHNSAAEDLILRQEIFGAISNEMSQAQEQIVMLGCKSAEERVASLFLMIARKTTNLLADTVEIGVPMTRLDMADCLGLTIETVCRVVAKLKRMNLVSFTGRNHAIIHSVRALAHFAGDDLGLYATPSLAS